MNSRPSGPRASGHACSVDRSADTTSQLRVSPKTVEEAPGRAEPRPATGEAQAGVQRPWRRRVFGG